MAGATVSVAAVALFLLRHPLTAVTVLIALVAAGAAGTSLAITAMRGDATDQPRLVAPGTTYRLPTPTEAVPNTQVRPVHQALHALDRTCRRPVSGRQGQQLRSTLQPLLRFARQHPNAGFSIDDETGTTMSLLIVIRAELISCAPQYLPRVEALLPEEFRQ